jgi:hypothetical protein
LIVYRRRAVSKNDFEIVGCEVRRSSFPPGTLALAGVLITGPHGFERTFVFALDDDPVIAARVRATLDQ